MNLTEEKAYSFIIIPPGAKRSLRLKLSQSMIFCTLSLFGTLVLIIGLLAYNTFRYKHNFREYSILKQQISTQHQQIREFQKNIDHLSLDIEKVLAQEYDISLLLGDIRRKRSTSKKKTVKK